MLRFASRRFFASSPQQNGKSSKFLLTAGLAAVGGASLFYYVSQQKPAAPLELESLDAGKVFDYKQVAKDIEDILESNPDYDGIGHYGPVLVRLAWHASGTYDIHSGTGGSNGATMRFPPECDFGANAGLGVARSLLEPIKQKYGNDLSYADLWTLAGVVAIREMGGPQIPWRSGRTDEPKPCPPDGRLPDATKTQDHIREIFYRMGFNDQEIVALCGAHAVGKCHTDRSGFKGPWSFSPTSFTNSYFTLLLSENWVPKTKDEVVDAKGKVKSVKWTGPAQFTDEKTKTLMMLPSDMALIQDKEFKRWVEVYAKDQDKFFADFSKAFARLLELGLPANVLATQPKQL